VEEDLEVAIKMFSGSRLFLINIPNPEMSSKKCIRSLHLLLRLSFIRNKHVYNTRKIERN
jgi:hypothetical protein